MEQTLMEISQNLIEGVEQRPLVYSDKYSQISKKLENGKQSH